MLRLIMPIVGIAASLGLGLGCASTAPTELVQARVAYRTAAEGRASTLAPEELQDARTSLATAEEKWHRDGDTRGLRETAYEAHIKAEHAMQVADLREVVLENRVGFNGGAGTSRIQAEAGEQHNPAWRMGRMREFATVTEGDHGLLIALAANLVFPTGSATLTTSASDKVQLIADVLNDNPDDTIAISGHTDSVGTEAYNKELSLQRADAVKAALVAAGVKADRILVIGRGEEHPIASNDSEHGRAKNRRVEIRLDDMPK